MLVSSVLLATFGLASDVMDLTGDGALDKQIGGSRVSIFSLHRGCWSNSMLRNLN
jgi:hypothetical protein